MTYDIEKVGTNVVPQSMHYEYPMEAANGTWTNFDPQIFVVVKKRYNFSFCW